MRIPAMVKRSACADEYHFTNALLIRTRNPTELARGTGRISEQGGDEGLRVGQRPGKSFSGMSSVGTIWAAIDATFTMATPSEIAPESSASRASFTFTVPSALIRLTNSASPIRG